MTIERITLNLRATDYWGGLIWDGLIWDGLIA